MSAVRKRKLTPAEYLAIERQAHFKSEYFDGEMFAMAGVKYEHNRVKENTSRLVGNQLANGPCVPLSSDMKVRSESTERYDRGAKFRHFQQVESIAEYILISQDEPLCERFVRQPDGNWLLTVFTGMDAKLALASVPATIPFSEIYAGIVFPVKPLPEAVGTFDREKNSRPVG